MVVRHDRGSAGKTLRTVPDVVMRGDDLWRVHRKALAHGYGLVIGLDRPVSGVHLTCRSAIHVTHGQSPYTFHCLHHDG